MARLIVCLSVFLPEVTVGVAVILPFKRVSSVAEPIDGALAVPFTVKALSFEVLLTKKLAPPFVMIVTGVLSLWVKKLSMVVSPLDMEITLSLSHLVALSVLSSAPKLYFDSPR